MRGKDVESKGTNQKFRITPAYAGKRIFHFSFPPILWDHPRLCGEKAEKLDEVLPREGSPPPMRGKGTVLSL